MNLLLDDLSIVVKNNFRLDDSKQAELLEEIKKVYFQNKPITHGCVPQFIDVQYLLENVNRKIFYPLGYLVTDFNLNFKRLSLQYPSVSFLTYSYSRICSS